MDPTFLAIIALVIGLALGGGVGWYIGSRPASDLKAKLAESVMIDASHANSRKQPARQVSVAEDIATQVARGDRRIIGLLLESFIEAGRQDVVDKNNLVYGQSITDPCMDWAQTVSTLHALAGAVQQRRKAA